MDNIVLPSTIVMIIGPISFIIGVVFGVALHRMLWRMDTATITSDLKNEQNYNRALQKQVFDLQTELEELRGRLRTLEEVNNELIQQERFRARSR